MRQHADGLLVHRGDTSLLLLAKRLRCLFFGVMFFVFHFRSVVFVFLRCVFFPHFFFFWLPRFWDIGSQLPWLPVLPGGGAAMAWRCRAGINLSTNTSPVGGLWLRPLPPDCYMDGDYPGVRIFSNAACFDEPLRHCLEKVEGRGRR